MPASTVNDAKRFGTLFEGGRLKLAREARAMTQADLSKAVNTTAPAVSQFEAAQNKPSAQTLAAIAKALDFPVSFFATPLVQSEKHAFFRSLRGASARNKSAARALAEIASMFVAQLERHFRLPSVLVPRHPLPPSGARATIEEAAARVRSQWKIPAGPIRNVISELERHGIVVARLPFNAAEIDAFSVAFTARPIVVLGSDKGAADRSRFDAAHELGHLVMHGDPSEEHHREIEQQAHWFAAAFLAPANELAAELPLGVDWQKLAVLKQRWGISMASLLMRGRDLGRISPTEYTRAMKYMSIKGWRKTEPVQLGAPERPSLLTKVVELVAGSGVSLSDIAEEGGLPAKLVEEIVGASIDARPRVEF